MSKYARRSDANHSPIIAAYEKLGVAVVDLSKAAQFHPGLPDLLCSLHGRMWLSETKTEDGKLNEAQAHFADLWKGPIFVVHDVDDVIDTVNVIKRMAL
jgi:hypothetical protein